MRTKTISRVAKYTVFKFLELKLQSVVKEFRRAERYNESARREV